MKIVMGVKKSQFTWSGWSIWLPHHLTLIIWRRIDNNVAGFSLRILVVVERCIVREYIFKAAPHLSKK